jgi:hypothetical protein
MHKLQNSVIGRSLLSLLIFFSIAFFYQEKVDAVGSYDNALIAEHALTYVTKNGGQCRVFVNKIVKEVSGGKQNPETKRYGGDYFQSFLKEGGIEVYQNNDLVKGDIVQVGQGGHTFIILYRISEKKFSVVDSNRDNKSEIVIADERNKDVVIDGKATRAFRMGTIVQNNPQAKNPISTMKPSDFTRKIVQWDGDSKSQKTSWLVTADAKRYWIPDSSTFNCLKANNYPEAGALPSAILDQLPDQHNQWVSCSGIEVKTVRNNPKAPEGSREKKGWFSGIVDFFKGVVSYFSGEDNTSQKTQYSSTDIGRGPQTAVVPTSAPVLLSPLPTKEVSRNDNKPIATATPTVQQEATQTQGINPPPLSDITSPPSTLPPTSMPMQPTAVPTPVPKTVWVEQSGSHGSPTFSNPFNASGRGPVISAMATVDVSCRIYAPQIQSANPEGWWYRIASTPWNNAYYAVANTFWNGDIPNQKPYTHYTDYAVPVCP